MELRIQEIKNKNIWENFLLNCEEKTFLISWNWGEFNKMMGNKIWRFGIFEKENLISVALVIKIGARRGTFLLVPHGPVIKERKSKKDEILKIFLEELVKTGKKEKADFIRISSIWEINEENIKIFKDLGFREAPIHIHPEITWELDISFSEEELLAKMRKTTRYLIRKGEKDSLLKVYQTKDLKNLEIFNQLYIELAKKENFVPFPKKYLENEFLAFLSDNQISLFFSQYKDDILAGGMFIFWQKIGFYHHGASIKKYPSVPASYLLLWEAIKEAKKRGCEKFNFWGIAPIFDSKHPWAGLTLFKMGFGGQKKEYLKTQDFPLSKKYWLNYFIEKLRKIKRGF